MSFKIFQNKCIAALATRYSDFYFELLPEIEFDRQELEEMMEE